MITFPYCVHIFFLSSEIVCKVSSSFLLSIQLPCVYVVAVCLLSRKGVGTAADIESTSVKPRQRPRPADSAVRPSQPQSVGSNGMSEPPTTTVAVTAAVAAANTNASNWQQLVAQEQLQPRQHDQDFKSRLQESLMLSPDQPPWSSESQGPAPEPQDVSSSLIDLDPARTLLANLDPLKSSFPAYPTSPFSAGQQLRPSFGYNVPPRADLFMSSSDGRFNPLSMHPGFASYSSGMMPQGHGLSYSMHGYGQQVVGYPPSVMPYSPLRMMRVPQQYPGVIAQAKTGSNNDLHMLQVR